METQLTLDDLPPNWLEVFRQQMISLAFEEERTCDTTSRRFRYWAHPSRDFTVTNNTLSSPLKFHDALRLYNAATLCYIIPKNAIEGDCFSERSGQENYCGPKVDEMQWRKHAPDEWNITIPDNTKFEGKYLVPVGLISETLGSSNWFGLGVKDSPAAGDVRKEEQHG